MKLTADLASKMAKIALAHTVREYPHKLDHVWNGPEDATTPRQQHPIFYGSFDWHSCVHGYWLLLRLLRLFPDLPEAAAIAAHADTAFTPAKIADELAYLDRPNSGGFERPYGWAWLLALHAEAAPTRWGPIIEPLARAFASRFRNFLPVQTYPIRNGSHANTAFALLLAHRWAASNDPALAAAITTRAQDWFGSDRDAQGWEPGGDDFLSPVLTEALCMKAVLAPAAFAVWFAAFLPHLAQGEPLALFSPATVSDRSDGKIAHLDGLNLSRAWAWRALGHPDLAALHLAAGLPHIAGDYAGEHWLATYALLALSD